ncbi:Transaldolase [compost metagenome]
MPQATLDAFADHGVVLGNTVAGTYTASRSVLETVESFGVSLAEVTERLEVEGVEKFETSWTDLLQTVADGLARAGGAPA